MTKVIRFLAQCIDQNTGDVLEESIMNEEVLQKATILQELGYTHIKQINFLQQMQDFKIKHQIILNTVDTCPSCKSKTVVVRQVF